MIIDIRKTPDIRNRGVVSILVDKDVPFGGRANRVMYEEYMEDMEMEMYYGKEE
jgi:hypothetical protein